MKIFVFIFVVSCALVAGRIAGALSYPWAGYLGSLLVFLSVTLGTYCLVAAILHWTWQRLVGLTTRGGNHVNISDKAIYVYRNSDGSISEPQSYGRLKALYRMHLLDPDTPVAHLEAPDAWQALKRRVIDGSETDGPS